MSYLKDFQTQIAHHDYPAVLRLWEEYCAADELDGEDASEILKAIKNSEIAEPFGRHVEKILPLWEKMENPKMSHEVLKLIVDLATTNHESLGQLIFNHLKQRDSDHPHFNERIRLIGLRSKDNFQGAISNYELLAHMAKGKYVFHTGGWGVGEIMDVSLVREQLTLEFDNISGRKDLSFANAFKMLIPIPDEHFYALRFGNPDLLEKQAKEHPLEVIRMLLRDLGPKTAAEIKDELCDLVIPVDEWTRWWQASRSKIKKDTFIETPDDLKECFVLRKAQVTHEERFQKALDGKPDVPTLILMVYSFLRDFPETLKNNDFKNTLQAKISETLSAQKVTDAEELQLHFLLEDLGVEKSTATVSTLISQFSSLEAMTQAIEIVAFKKRTLVEVRSARKDWQDIFLSLFLTIEPNSLRDYLLTELNSSETATPLKRKLEELIDRPFEHPEVFLWYFQKITAPGTLPFATDAGRTRFFESFLVLLSHVERDEAKKDLIKKIHTILSAGRYAVVRQIMQISSIEEVQEFLLLATKCHSLSDHDIKILYSLAEVVHPSLGKTKKLEGEAGIIWTSQEGYQKLQQRIQQIATIETVQNAREIEVARSHGDLRENQEFKSALEKRDRLQSEVKFLSEQLNASRVITKSDISLENIGVGNIVECKNEEGKKVMYTLLGPFDADPEKHILSFQSKLAQTMTGLTIGDKFKFQEDEFTVIGIRSFI